MSWARFGTSDVYVYEDVRGGITCCGCRLLGDYNCETVAEMIEHLEQHAAAGHNVTEAMESARAVLEEAPR